MSGRVLMATIVEGYTVVLSVDEHRGRSFYRVSCSCTDGACCVELDALEVHEAFERHAASHRTVDHAEQLGLAL